MDDHRGYYLEQQWNDPLLFYFSSCIVLFWYSWCNMRWSVTLMFDWNKAKGVAENHWHLIDTERLSVREEFEGCQVDGEVILTAPYFLIFGMRRLNLVKKISHSFCDHLMLWHIRSICKPQIDFKVEQWHRKKLIIRKMLLMKFSKIVKEAGRKEIYAGTERVKTLASERPRELLEIVTSQAAFYRMASKT